MIQTHQMTPCENNFNLSIKKCQEISIFVLIGKLWGVIQTIFFLVIAYIWNIVFAIVQGSPFFTYLLLTIMANNLSENMRFSKVWYFFLSGKSEITRNQEWRIKVLKNLEWPACSNPVWPDTFYWPHFRLFMPYSILTSSLYSLYLSGRLMSSWGV